MIKHCSFDNHTRICALSPTGVCYHNVLLKTTQSIHDQYDETTQPEHRNQSCTYYEKWPVLSVWPVFFWTCLLMFILRCSTVNSPWDLSPATFISTPRVSVVWWEALRHHALFHSVWLRCRRKECCVCVCPYGISYLC